MLFKSQGKKPQEIRESLIQFCSDRYPDIPIRKWLVPIGRAVRFAQKPDSILVECPYVDMYTSEVDFIDEQPISDGAKRVLFTIMVQKKLDKHCYESRRGGTYTIFSYANNARMSSMKRIAGLPNGYSAVEGLHELYRCGLIDVIHSKGSPYRLNFVDRFTDEGKLAIRITDYEQLGLYWDWLHCSRHAYVCVRCWKPFKSHATNRCYCDEHQGYQVAGVAQRRMRCCVCGAEFTVDLKNTRTTRCVDCQNKKRQQDAKRRLQRYREKHDNATS